MSIQSRVGKLEAMAGVNQDENVAVIVMSFDTPDGSPKPSEAIICSGPLSGTTICPEDGESEKAFSERVDRILHGL